MRIALLVGLLVVTLGLATAAQFEPTGTVECIAPANPGGGWDTICRTTTRVLTEIGILTQPTIVTNMPGGSGAVAIAHVVEERKGDPNLIVAASNSLTFSMAIGRTPYTWKDVTPLAQIASEFGAYVVRNDSPFQSLSDLVNALKADPKSVSFGGGSAPGSMDHIKVALLGKAIGINPQEMVYVPFQGGGEALAALLGGQVDVAPLDVSEVIGQLEAGQVRILAVLSEERLTDPRVANIPTAREQGVDVVFPVWRGLYMAPDVPYEAIAFWRWALEQMVASDQWNEARSQLAWEPVTKFGHEFIVFVNQELETFKTLLKELGF